jgi:AcrR family transcriptional regulator
MTQLKQQRSDSRRNRQAVVAAAMEVLPGDPTASMATIAERSGLGRTTVYRHFPARADLVRALFEHVVEEATVVTSEVIERGGTTRETMRALGPAIIGIADRFRFLAGLRDTSSDQVITDSTLDPNQPTRHFVEAAQRRGEIHPEMPVQWILTSINTLAGGASTEMHSGRLTREEAGRLLGETMVRAFVVGT